MAFEEADRVAIRRYLGFAAIFLQADPRLENAISAIQCQDDPGGTRPDNTSEVAVRSYLTDLAGIEAQLAKMRKMVVAATVGSVKVDPARAIAVLRGEGRRLVGYLADTLSTRPVRDVFSAPGLLADTETFSRSYMAQAWRSV